MGGSAGIQLRGNRLIQQVQEALLSILDSELKRLRHKITKPNQAWWFMPIIPALRRQKW